MRDAPAQLAFAVALWLALGSTPAAWGQNVALATKEQGRDALATREVLQEPALLGDSPLLPVTVEHQGRLLVLTYGPKSSGGLMADPNPRREPRRFAIYRGARQIAAGQFEYG